MSGSGEVETLQARIVELEQENANLKAQLKQSTSLLFEKPKNALTLGKVKAKKYGDITLKLMKMKNEGTDAVRTQVVDWLNTSLNISPALTNESFMDRLSDGLLLCQLCEAISLEETSKHIPRIHTNAAPYSVRAYENVRGFIKCCVEWGVDARAVCNENDLLNQNVQNRNERNVVYTILALSRVGYTKYGFVPPQIIAAELQIDQLNVDISASSSSTSTTATPSNANSTSTPSSANNLDARDITGLSVNEANDIQTALESICTLQAIPLPTKTKTRGQYVFSDGSIGNVRIFNTTNIKYENVLDGVATGGVTLLVRANQMEWTNLYQFYKEGSKKNNTNNVTQINIITNTDSNTPNGTNAPAIPKRPKSMSAGTNTNTMDGMNVPSDGSEGSTHTTTNTTTNTTNNYYTQEQGVQHLPAETVVYKEYAMTQPGMLTTEEEEESSLSAVLEDMSYSPSTAHTDSGVELYAKYANVTAEDVENMDVHEKRKYQAYTAKQEFFFLTFASFKLNLLSQPVYHSLIDVSVLDTEACWKDAVEKDTPFHKFYEYIKNETTKKYLEYEMGQRRSSRGDLRSRRESVLQNLGAHTRPE